MSPGFAMLVPHLCLLISSAVLAQGPTPAPLPDPPPSGGVDIQHNQQCVGGCYPCVKPVEKQCHQDVSNSCQYKMCDILFGVHPNSVVTPPVQIWYTKCHHMTGSRGTGLHYWGFEALQDPLSPEGYKDVAWPRDVVCTVTFSCSCDGASLDPNILSFCHDGEVVEQGRVRRTHVFDPTLTCDNVLHPAHPAFAKPNSTGNGDGP